MFRFLGYLCLTIFFGACTFSSREWLDLQRDFVQQYPHADLFVLNAGADTLRLPLPPDPVKVAQWPRHVESLRRQAHTLDSTALTESEKRQWKQLTAALETESRREYPGLDTVPYLLDDLLRHFVGRDQIVRHPALLTTLIEKIPEYYIQVQRRQQTPRPWTEPRYFERAAQMVEQLHKIESNLPYFSAGYRERLQRALPEALAALKDYFSWRQSGSSLRSE